ncbi:ATP-binding protein [Allonocardiopsis opalescens]|uniref:Anti-sigma regulatory factor (Ser/Thr protein kinase) n=1 Tax=Allonocardiopsis opalescens TaxID=1144618 RepID=A0A2T0QE51_9ACTN|nr:ATP-binding protein [Allonocardiopsis opalescens]PRY02151.1 anti-sigma regulatory factor (Ser/Thr protein kinase) [Allonocardiopsis opalescens]
MVDVADAHASIGAAPGVPHARVPSAAASAHARALSAAGRSPSPVNGERAAAGGGAEPPSAPPAAGGVRRLRRRFPGLAGQVKHARRFVARALGAAPVTDTAVLLTSELVTNALVHTRSGVGSGKFVVIVHIAPGWSRVEVRDQGSPHSVPHPVRGARADDAEGGRGIGLVEALADRWGFELLPLGRLVWFEVDHPAGPEEASPG